MACRWPSQCPGDAQRAGRVPFLLPAGARPRDSWVSRVGDGSWGPGGDAGNGCSCDCFLSLLKALSFPKRCHVHRLVNLHNIPGKQAFMISVLQLDRRRLSEQEESRGCWSEGARLAPGREETRPAVSGLSTRSDGDRFYAKSPASLFAPAQGGRLDLLVNVSLGDTAS